MHIDGLSSQEFNDQELRTLGQRIGVIKKLHRLKRSVSVSYMVQLVNVSLVFTGLKNKRVVCTQPETARDPRI